MSVERARSGNGWVARWREQGHQCSRQFDRRADAQRWDAEVRRRHQLGPLAVQQLTARGGPPDATLVLLDDNGQPWNKSAWQVWARDRWAPACAPSAWTPCHAHMTCATALCRYCSPWAVSRCG
jgi:hypothetical protein